MSDTLQPFLRHREAYEFIEAVDDAALKRALRYALGMAMTRFVRWDGLSDAEYEAMLPRAPFDLLVFAELVAQLCRSPDDIVRPLTGPEPSWDNLPGDPGRL